MKTCRACGSTDFELVIDLGEQSPPNALAFFRQPEKVYPLRMVVCKSCWLMQTEVDVPPEEIFDRDYPFFSGHNPPGIEHGKQFAAHMTERLGLGPDSFVVEVGGNDGSTLLNFKCHTLNVEPAENVAKASSDAGISTHNGIWQGACLATKANLIYANNVMAHTPDLHGFIASLVRNLAPDGTVVIEFPWALTMLEDCEFDTIYHEHYSYLSLTALIPLFVRHGLYIGDVEHLPDLHGGTLRIYADFDGEGPTTEMLGKLHNAEEALRHSSTYKAFRKRANGIRTNFLSLLAEVGPIYGYGAAGKASVFLNYCGVTDKQITAIGDTTPSKWYKLMPNTHIPIIKETDLIALQPEWVVVLPWNWKREIIQRLRPQLPKTKFIAAIPEVTISEGMSV